MENRAKKIVKGDTKSVVNEPLVSYSSKRLYRHTTTYSVPDMLKHPVALLGLSLTKPYNEAQGDFDYISLIREGLPKAALDSIANIAGFSNLEIAHIVHTSERTLRRYAPKQKLDAEQSERVLELARLYSRGEEVFGTMDLFKRWMDKETLVLGEKKPKSFLDTSLGIEMIMDELGRIEQGVFA